MLKITNNLTVAWAQHIVNCHSPNVTVSDVDISCLDVGTTSRVRLHIDHNGPETLPRRWFVKLPSLSRRARLITALPQLLHREVRFYQEIASSVPVTYPHVLAAQRRWGRGATLVLADVTENGAIAGSAGDALNAYQAALVVEELARLHARFWHKTSFGTADSWLAKSIRRQEDYLGSALAVPLMTRGLQRAGSVIPTALHTGALHYARRRRQAMRFLNSGPLTLVHHDLHPGNLFWHNSKPGFLDWQLVRVGEGIGDIAYFLATALTPETRRTHEAQLISKYHQALAQHGIADIDPAMLWQKYRAHLTYPFEAMVVTLAVGGMMVLEANIEFIRRAVAAIEDHDAFARLWRKSSSKLEYYEMDPGLNF